MQTRSDVSSDSSAQTTPSLSATDRRRRRRVAIATFSGTLIEQYDFTIFAIAAALVFPHVLFPGLDSVAATIMSFATYGVAFFFRPLGAIVFGHFGDRVGRKKTLIATLVLMGVATTLIGAIPTGATIGIAAPIIVAVLRALQGFSAGGEWAGANLFAAEHAPPTKRGRWTMFPQMAIPASGFLGSSVFLLLSVAMSRDAFLAWGWRLPFLASAVLLAVGLYVRLKVDETPAFLQEITRGPRARAPIGEALRYQWRQILIAAGAIMSVFATVSLTGTFLANYGTETLGHSKSLVLAIGSAGAVFTISGTIAGALLSDRIGRRPVIISANMAAMVIALLMFPIMGVGSAVAFALPIFLLDFVRQFAYGPYGALSSELFLTRYRYTGAAMSYGLAAVMGSSLGPLIFTVGAAGPGPFWVGALVATYCVVSALCAFALPETRRTDLNRQQVAVGSKTIDDSQQGAPSPPAGAPTA